jgi:hypothetical protein
MMAETMIKRVAGYSDVPVIERITRALCAEYLQGCLIFGTLDEGDIGESWREWIEPARALLTNMRDPTLHMIIACGDLPGSIQHDWPRLIDAALSEISL